MNRVGESYTTFTGEKSAAGANEVIAAPAATRRIVWRKIKLVNKTASALTVIIKYGATSKMTSVLAAEIGAGEIYYEEEGEALPAGTALNFDLSGATAVSFDVTYLTESV